MFDSIFEEAMKKADAAIYETFGNVDVLVNGQEPVRGIFDAEGLVSRLAAGGQVDTQEARLSVRSGDAHHLARRTPITLMLSDGQALHFYIEQRYPQYDGETQFTLSERADGQSSTIPDLRY
nr:head-tail joining protein [Vibrio sp. V39_P1S14PM300]